jgi:spore germination protein YaaH
MTMSVRRAAAAALVLSMAACGAAPEVTAPQPTAAAGSAIPDPTGPAPTVTVPGHELYGYLPYWEMDDPGIAEHVAATPLTTLAMFSVTHTAKGALNANGRGYRAITGDTGRRLIREARERGVRVELAYTSFGGPRNRRLLEDEALQAEVIRSLVALAAELEVDGINVDVEALDPVLVPAYGSFVADLRAAVLAQDPSDTVSVATGAHALGAGMAVAAAAAGADRIFLMGYDYRTGRSEPGATSPLDRSDGGTASLRRSLDLYAALGVPADRLLLGLPLYGVEWPVAGPVIGAPSTGRGEAWFPRAHVDLLGDPSIQPERDEVEQVEIYLLGSDGSVGGPPAEPSSSASPAASVGPARTWRAVYVDSPETLAPKLGLANERGLAGAGWWAIGYDRGLPAYTRLMEQFVAGEALP